MRTALQVVALPVVGLLGLGAACFSERAGGPVLSGECSVPVSVIGAGHVVVAIRGFAFAPDSIQVPVGGTVTWVNCEPAGTGAHTTTADDGTTWDSPTLVTGQRYSHTFAAGGVFPYHCDPHPSMQARVVVQ